MALILASRAGRTERRRRGVAIGLVGVAVVANLTALGLLSHYLIGGGRASGSSLIGGGVLIWTTSWLLFGVLYWEIDRGGPVRAAGASPSRPTCSSRRCPIRRSRRREWMPTFVDYLYVSLTNQTAFSPTDTMPLTIRLKLLMGVQGVAGLVTIGVIVARAVNILG